MKVEEINLQPQEGPQKAFLTTSADIAIYGGSAGGGKSYALLLEPLRHYNKKDFRAVIFRRTTKQIRVSGGLWDESHKMYSMLNGTSKETTLEWNFPKGLRVQFSHLEHDNNRFDYQGSQIPCIGFDELNHFSDKQFFYMLSRNRSTTGVSGYIRATTNPDPDSWVRKFIDWWIDERTGLAIKARSGKLRWFVRDGDNFVWANTKEELTDQYGDECFPKSLTFISASVFDNKILMQKDPSYIANLKALPKLDREQLLGANWNIRPSAGIFFKRHYFEVVDAVPAEIVKIIRCWDRAATKVEEGSSQTSDPDYTVGVKMAQTRNGLFYVLDVVRERRSTLEVERLTLNTARQDGIETKVKIFQDPGSAGVYEAQSYMRLLSGFNIECEKIIKDKITACKPVSAQSEAGNVKILRARWNDTFFSELENFPEGKHDDQVDAFSGAFNGLTSDNVGDFTSDYLDEANERNTGNLQW